MNHALSRRTTTKNDLARQVAAASGITMAQAEQAIDLVIEGIKRSVKAGNRVEFRRFGVFEQRRCKERIRGAHFKTGAQQIQPATTKLVFKTARHLIETGE